MVFLKTSGLSATATIALAMLLQGCVSTGNDDGERATARNACQPGETLVCDTRSSGRISDGRYGRRGRNGRVNSCGCVPDRDMEALERETLPADIN